MICRPNKETVSKARFLLSNYGALNPPEDLLRRCKLIALWECPECGLPLSVRAIKNPFDSYRKRLFYDAGIPELADKYLFESGYSATVPQKRNKGISTYLLYQLLSELDKPVFATTRVDNLPAQKVLEKAGFKRVGKEFSGILTDLYLFTWK